MFLLPLLAHSVIGWPVTIALIAVLIGVRVLLIRRRRGHGRLGSPRRILPRRGDHGLDR